MKYLNVDCPNEIHQEVKKEYQVLQREHKVNNIEINKLFWPRASCI